MASTDNNKLTFIADCLIRRMPLPETFTSDADKLLSYRYLDAGHIDSFGLMQFMTELEDRFDIEFQPEDTQSDAFRTIGGLVSIIEKRQVICGDQGP